jgi:hypothetical protein
MSPRHEVRRPACRSISAISYSHAFIDQTDILLNHIAPSLPFPSLLSFSTSLHSTESIRISNRIESNRIESNRIVSYRIESNRTVSNHIVSHPGIATYSTLLFPSLLLYSQQTVCTTPPASPKGSQAGSLARPLSSGKVVGEGGGGGGYLDLRRVRQRRRSFNEGVCENGTGIGAGRDAESCQIVSSPQSPSPHSPSPSKTLSRPRSRSRSQSP